MRTRFKNRISAFTKANKKACRLAFAFAFILSIASNASAQIKNNVDVFFVVTHVSQPEDNNIFTRTYTKEELSEKAPANPTSDLATVVQTQVTSFLQVITAQQNSGKLMEIYNGAAAKNKSDFALYAATMRDDRLDTGRDGDQLRKYVAGELQNTASDRALKSNEMLAKVRTGLNFNLDLGDIFSKKAKPQAASGLRYGLIIEDIKPDTNAPGRAALGDSVEDQMAYAGRAEVLWTIGPIGEEPSKPFSNAVVTESQTSESSLFSRFRAPSGKFNAKLDPASDAIQGGGSPGIPAVKLTMSQEQGFYEMIYQTKTNFEKDKIEHQVKVPIVGELAFGRRYSETYDVTQTSAFNVLVDKRAPALNIHYINSDSHYAAELRMTRNRHEFGANADMASGWKTSDKLGKTPGEKYRCEYKFSF